MSNRKANGTVDLAVSAAVNIAVSAAVYRDVRGAVRGAVWGAVWGAVDDSEHPALQDFLRAAGAQAWGRSDG
jgi:hypothetical protein